MNNNEILNNPTGIRMINSYTYKNKNNFEEKTNDINDMFNLPYINLSHQITQ